MCYLIQVHDRKHQPRNHCIFTLSATASHLYADLCLKKYYVECRADKEEDHSHADVPNEVVDEEGGSRNRKMDERRNVTEDSRSRPDDVVGGNAGMEAIDKKGEIALVEPDPSILGLRVI